MNQAQYEQQMMDDMEDFSEDQGMDGYEDHQLNQQEFQDAYGAPEPEERHNQHTFLATSLNRDDPEKVTWLSESELGRPLFNIRFLLDIEDICHYYLDGVCTELSQPNEIAKYFREKINNVCDSGMSNKGFVQNLNVTRRMDTKRERVRNIQPIKKGGEK